MGGGIDLDIICANLCSSSRKPKWKWQLNTQNWVLCNLWHLLLTKLRVREPVTSLRPFAKGTTSECCALSNMLDLPVENEFYIHIKNISRCWLGLSDCSGYSVSPRYPCNNLHVGKKTSELFRFAFLKTRIEVWPEAMFDRFPNGRGVWWPAHICDSGL